MKNLLFLADNLNLGNILWNLSRVGQAYSLCVEGYEDPMVIEKNFESILPKLLLSNQTPHFKWHNLIGPKTFCKNHSAYM